MRNLPTFATIVNGAYAKDTRNGALSAFLGALCVGLAFGTLGAAGAPVALLGAFLSLAGIAGMVGPRPLDKTLFRPAVALPYSFACKVHKVNAHLAPLNLGGPTATAKRAYAAYIKAIEAPTPVLARALGASYKATDRLKLERARWAYEWPMVREPISEMRARMVASVVH